jgi:hypothetical protein
MIILILHKRGNNQQLQLDHAEDVANITAGPDQINTDG